MRKKCSVMRHKRHGQSSDRPAEGSTLGLQGRDGTLQLCVCVLKLKLSMLGDTQTFGVFRRRHSFYLKVTVVAAAALKHFLTVSSVVASSAPVQSVNANTVSRNVLLSIYIPVRDPESSFPLHHFPC